MRKRRLIAVLLAASIATANTTAFAAGSISCPQTNGLIQVSPGVYKVCLGSRFGFSLTLPGNLIPDSIRNPQASCPATSAPAPTAPVTTAKPTATPSPSPDHYTQAVCSAQAQQMAQWINQERVKNGLSQLPLDASLCKVATVKSQDMLDKNYFAHESPTYGSMATMLKTFGVPFASCGENIASHASISKAHAAFMSSEGHRRNILTSSWTRMGIGVVFDRNGFVRVTEVFAR